MKLLQVTSRFTRLGMLTAVGLTAALAAAGAQAQAQAAWPAQPIKVIVPYPAGGNADADLATHFFQCGEIALQAPEHGHLVGAVQNPGFGTRGDADHFPDR